MLRLELDQRVRSTREAETGRGPKPPSRKLAELPVVIGWMSAEEVAREHPAQLWQVPRQGVVDQVRGRLESMVEGRFADGLPVESRKVAFAGGERQVTFNRLTRAGRRVADELVDQIYAECGRATAWEEISRQAQDLTGELRPLGREIAAQAEVGRVLEMAENRREKEDGRGEASESYRGYRGMLALGDYFAERAQRFVVRSAKTGRLGLAAEGKRFAQAAFVWLERAYPELEFVELQKVVDGALGSTVESRLLRRSLAGKLAWLTKQAHFEALQGKTGSVMMTPELFVRGVTEKGQELWGAARFQVELAKLIQDLEGGNRVDAEAEVQAYETVLAEEAQRLEVEAARWAGMTRWQRAKQKWTDFKLQAREDGFWQAARPALKKLAYAAVAGMSLGMVVGPAVAGVFHEFKWLPEDHSRNPGDSLRDGRGVGRLEPNRLHRPGFGGLTPFGAGHEDAANQSAYRLPAERTGGETETSQPALTGDEGGYLNGLGVRHEKAEAEAALRVAAVTQLKDGQPVQMAVGESSFDLVLKEGDNSGPDDVLILNTRDLNPEDERTNVWRIHSGSYDGRTLVGSEFKQAVIEGREIRMKIDNQVWKFVPRGEPVVMDYDDIPNGLYTVEDIEREAETRGLTERGQRFAGAVETCFGKWLPEKGHHEQRAVYFFELVPVNGLAVSPGKEVVSQASGEVLRG